QLTGWSPTHNGPWTWLPWTLLFCERLLRAPRRRDIAGLAVTLALEVLPGWVLIAALTYQLIALRLGWELVTRRAHPPWRSLGSIVAGLLLGPLLVAVQLVPAAELAHESVRVALGLANLAYGGLRTDVGASIRARVPPVPFMVGPLLLAALAPF